MQVHTARELGLLIRERRRELKLDQKTLASRVGVSRQWIIEVEKGKPRAEVDLVLRTLNLLGLQVHVDSHSGTTRTAVQLPYADVDAVIERARGRSHG